MKQKINNTIHYEKKKKLKLKEEWTDLKISTRERKQNKIKKKKKC